VLRRGLWDVGGYGGWQGMGGRSEEAAKRRRNAQSCGLAQSRVLVLLGRGVGGCYLLCEVRAWARRGIGLRGIRGLGLILSRAGVHALCSAFLYNPRRPIQGPKAEPITQKKNPKKINVC
jgi:hypothetical protein